MSNICLSNIVSSRSRSRKSPDRYVDPDFSNMMVKDIPKSEIFAALIDDDLKNVDFYEIIEEKDEDYDVNESQYDEDEAIEDTDDEDDEESEFEFDDDDDDSDY